MHHKIFPSSFYWSFQVSNLKEISDYVETKTTINNSTFDWAYNCSVDTISLEIEDTLNLIKPAISEFIESAFNKEVNLNIYNPWINIYQTGYFQEVHDHNCDIAATIFLNDGPNFSRFFFLNRYNNCISNRLLNLLTEVNIDTIWEPQVKAGTILFFPGTMLHGVSPHKSEIIRKTMSFNMDIFPY